MTTMMVDPVKGICDELGVCREEAICYLDGFQWNLDSAMEACRNQTSPFPLVTNSRSIYEQRPFRLNDRQSFSQASVDHRRAIGWLNSQRVSLSGDETSKELMQYIYPSMGLYSFSPSQFRVSKQDYLKQVRIGSSASRNRWPAYVKSCNEMVAFLTAAALAYLPIRYIIDAQQQYGSQLHGVDFMKILFSLFDDFTSIDPFIFIALAYAATYIFSTSSVSPFVKRMAEATSIVFGFGIVFLVIYYISPITCYLGLGSIGLSIGLLTCREVRIA